MSNLYYAWTNRKSVSDSKVKPLLSYLDRNRAYLISVDDFIFDATSLYSEITMKFCTRCREYQKSNCCSGNSESMSEENADMLRSKAGEILKVIPNNSKLLGTYLQYGALTKDNSTTTRGNVEGNCIFNYKDVDGRYKCSIDTWASRNNEEVLKYKPYICSMFPLEGIVMPNGKTFVYCITRDTQDFSLHFHTSCRMVCINKENLVRVCSGEVGGNSYLKSLNSEYIIEHCMNSKTSYAFLEMEKVLRFLCGDKVYERLVLAI